LLSSARSPLAPRRAVDPQKGPFVHHWRSIVLVAAVALEQLVLPILKGRMKEIDGRRAATNLGIGMSYRLLVQPAITVPMMLWAATHPLWHRPLSLEGPSSYIVDLLILDFYNWFFHWAGHKNAFLWRFHAVHHLDEKMDMSTGLRSHWFDRIGAATGRSIVVAALGIPMTHVALAELVAFLCALFHHCEGLKIPTKIEDALGWVIVMPRFHAVHHVPTLPYTDSNYGSIFSIWDTLCGTVVLRAPLPQQRRGLEDIRDPGLLGNLFGPFLPGWRHKGPPAADTVDASASTTAVVVDATAKAA
jgi:sterol desaturase/sphingolipid hydroxylase (fatty acid hydroxylase superfamily)